MKIIVIPVSHGTIINNSASEQIRCDWLLPYINADKYDGSQSLANYDVIIYQKSYKPGLAKHYNEQGKLQILDLTDPIWYITPINQLRAMYDYIDIFIFSTHELEENLKLFFPFYEDKKTYTIIDRIELSEFKTQKIHKDKKPIFVWFGYSENFLRISHILPHIQRYELKVICERDIGIGSFVKWNRDTVNEEILKCDIVINPLCPEILKTSLNKTLRAWALGLPVVDQIGDIERLTSFIQRQKAQVEQNELLNRYYRMEISGIEMINIINENVR